MHSDDMNGQRDGLYEREVQRLLGMKNSVHLIYFYIFYIYS